MRKNVLFFVALFLFIKIYSIPLPRGYKQITEKIKKEKLHFLMNNEIQKNRSSSLTRLLDATSIHNLVYKSTPIVNLKTVKPEDSLSVSFSFGNENCKKNFTGNIALVLVDADAVTDIKYILKQNALTDIVCDSISIYSSYLIYGFIPKDIKNGKYRIDIVARENESQNWKPLGGKGGGGNDPFEISMSFLSIEDIDTGNKEIHVYPNPVKDILKITSQSGVKEIKVYDYTGREVRNFTSIQNNQINVQDLPSGNYILTIKTDKETLTKKIIKK